MAKWQKPIYFSEDSDIFENINELKKIFWKKTNTSLLEYVVELELFRQNIPSKDLIWMNKK